MVTEKDENTECGRIVYTDEGCSDQMTKQRIKALEPGAVCDRRGPYSITADQITVSIQSRRWVELVRTRSYLQLQLNDETLFVKYHKLTFKNFWGGMCWLANTWLKKTLHDRIVRLWTD